MPTNKVAKDDTLQSLVSAVEDIASLMGDGVIDDTSTATDKTWSASKENTTVNGLKSNIIANTKLIKDTVGWSGKNKFKYKRVTVAGSEKTFPFSVNNLNVSKDSDDAVSVGGGIASATTQIFLWLDGTIEAGDYILSGCPSGGGSSKYDVRTDNNHKDEGNGVNINLASDVGSTFYVVLTVYSGCDLTTPIKFKTMIRDADIIDDTYEPYFGSTAFPRSEQAVLGAKNVIKNNLASSSTANVEVVVNSDKSVSMSNTANADVWLTVYSGLNFLPKGHWHLNGCPSNGGAEKYFLCFIVRNAGNTANETTYYDYGDGVDFDITDANINRSIRINIYVKSGQATDFTYYPMISLDGGSYVAPAMTNKDLTENCLKKIRVLSANEDLDNIRFGQEGIYPCAGETLVHAPTGFNGYGQLILLSYGGMEVQILIAARIIYTRIRTSAWQNWYKFEGTEMT